MNRMKLIINHHILSGISPVSFRGPKFTSNICSCHYHPRKQNRLAFCDDITVFMQIWHIYTGWNRDRDKDRERMGCVKLCGHISPWTRTGSRPIVPHSSGPGSVQCEYTIWDWGLWRNTNFARLSYFDEILIMWRFKLSPQRCLVFLYLLQAWKFV